MTIHLLHIFADFQANVYTNLVANNRWALYLEGLGNTLLIAAGATLIGTLIGLVVAIIKVYAVDNKKLAILNGIATLYITLIRGTPTMVQLLIMYNVIFAAAAADAGVPIAIMTFGINSGAYVAEIFRAGILAVDRGQMEAGRSLGLNKNTTMRLIILPQAVKNILPPLFSEFIVLIKETSIAGMVAVRELTKAANIVASRTFEYFIPLLFVALVYLLIVTGLTALQAKLERRLRTGDIR